MAINLVQFPLTVSEWQKSVMYSTDIFVGRNGQEVRNALWQDPLLKFNAAFAVRSYADINTLATFFHAMKGREQSFLVKDWSDFKVDSWTAPNASGTVTTVQLIKRYTQPTINTTYIRTIKYPAANSVTIRNSGSPFTPSSVNLSTGVVTLGGSYTASNLTFQVSEFYVACRFDIDELPIEMLNYWVASGADKSNVQVPDIPLIEVRNP